MDLEDERFKFESPMVGEGKNSETLEKMGSLDRTKVGINGDLGSRLQIGVSDGMEEERESMSPAEAIWADPGESKAKGHAIELENSVESPLKEIESSKKGYGLKKWRRIRRDVSKDGSGGFDSSQMHKRRLPLGERPMALEKNKQSDVEEESSSVASVESKILGMTSSKAFPRPLEPVLGLSIAFDGFSIGVDSENSEDHSSKLSTNASAPKMRHETGGSWREKSRTKSSGGRGSGHIVQQKSLTERGLDASKKHRGDQVSFEVENSHSSVESDLRSTGAAFVSNGNHVENVDCDGEQTDEGQQSEEVRSGYCKENGSVMDLLREDSDVDPLNDKIEKSKNDMLLSDNDPFDDSIVLLRTAQEALENEIRKLVEIGKEPMLDQFDGHYEEAEVSSSPGNNTTILELIRKVQLLENKLEEASATINTKEIRLLELELILHKTQLRKTELENADLLLQEKCKEIEIELECLLAKNMEAEVQYLVMRRTNQNWKIMAEDHIALLKEQKSLTENHSHMMLKLQDNEHKAIMLKEQAENLEAHCKELSENGEALELQNNACKVSIFCFIQLLMLFISLGLFLVQLLPPSSEVVPT